MIREIDPDWITDEKLLTKDDLAPVGCHDCAGCSSCCTDTAVMIVLDPWDAALLKSGLNYSFEGLLARGLIQLQVIDGIVLPGLGTDETGACVFLGGDGRCTIHPFRPGICRMFPLARIWQEDGSFAYFLQEEECDRRTGEKIPVREWLGYDRIDEYEQAAAAYHEKLNELKILCAEADTADEITRLQTIFIKEHFF